MAKKRTTIRGKGIDINTPAGHAQLLASDLFKNHYSLGHKWDGVIGLAESADAKAICVGLAILSSQLYQPDAAERLQDEG